MQQNANRVIDAINAWKRIEEENGNSFTSAMSSTDYLAEKLQHYDRAASMFRKPNGEEERISLRFLKREIKDMEKALYPKLDAGYIARMIVKTINMIRPDNRWAMERSFLKSTLPDQLLRGGYSDVVDKVVEQIDRGYSVFKVRSHAYLNENRHAHIDFVYDKDGEGKIGLSRMEVTMPDIKNPQKDIKLSLSVREVGILNILQLKNLSSGRLVEKTNQQGFGPQANSYLEKVDQEVRIVRAKINLSPQLKDLPFVELATPENFKKIEQSLKMGNQEVVNHLDGKSKYTLAISKYTHEVQILDDKGTPVSLQDISLQSRLATANITLNKSLATQQEQVFTVAPKAYNASQEIAF